MSIYIPELKPCPFCGEVLAYNELSDVETGIEICNTHTPSFWIECHTCGAEVHPNGEDHKKAYDDKNYGAAMQAAIDAWNRRV